MTGPQAPATPLEVSQHLGRSLDSLKNHVRLYAEAERKAVRARHIADLTEAKEFLSAEGAVEARKQTAFVAAEALLFDAEAAEAEVRIAKAKIRAIEAEIDIGRTHGATVRAEFKTMGYGAE